ncbi:MAG: CoA activase [Deltaproteobacteria bacterium]|nr:MAG: CoA activase [Deltaproteobacteria bacterium]
MITAGIDMGAAYSKVAILEDGKVIGKAESKTTLEPEESVERARELALKDANIDPEQISAVGVTGSGRSLIKDADVSVTDVTADAAGAHYFDKDVRTVIDIGGEEARAVKIDGTGKVINFAVNDKCAAGAGAFVEAMSRALEISMDDFAAYSLKSTERIAINAQCAIFAESEVVSLISDEVGREDICRAVHDGISERITSMAKKVQIEDKVALIGGAVLNRGLVQSLKDDLGTEPTVLADAQFVSAVGAAILAAKGSEG